MTKAPGYEYYLEKTGYYSGGRKVALDEGKMERMRRMAAFLGDPQNEYVSVHVAGTKGKGSCAAMCAAALEAVGMKTGLYLSPHISDLRERIQASGEMISPEELSRQMRAMAPLFESDDPPTFFEAMTLAAFAHFKNEGVEAAVFEAGIGGRWTATNVIEPACAVITSIGKEHAEIIGPDVEHIAREKAGVARKGRPLVTGPLSGTALETVKAECERLGAEFRMASKPLKRTLALPGKHQRWNAACALEAAKIACGVDEEIALDAIARVTLPGRFEVFDGNPTVVLDGAHTVVSARNLRQAMGERFPGKYVLVYATKASKQYRGMLDHLCPGAEKSIFTGDEIDGFLASSKLADGCMKRGAKNVEAVASTREALEKAKMEAGRGGVVLVTGSFYLVGDVRNMLLG